MNRFKKLRLNDVRDDKKNREGGEKIRKSAPLKAPITPLLEKSAPLL